LGAALIKATFAKRQMPRTPWHYPRHGTSPHPQEKICRLLFIDGKTVSQVVHLTKHSTRAIDRYITN
jgi:hypothetical protein